MRVDIGYKGDFDGIRRGQQLESPPLIGSAALLRQRTWNHSRPLHPLPFRIAVSQQVLFRLRALPKAASTEGSRQSRNSNTFHTS
ncbi:hypothetical protein E2542_SST22958 [Spatholobus suberectus]|nr:hypothetical protein E2542_SST22958 [Spatholobus suberectus]